MSANRSRRHHKNNDAVPPTSLPNASATAWVAVGEIVGAFSLHGEVKVWPLTDFPERFAQTPTLYLGDARTPYAVRGARQHQRITLLKLEGIEDVVSAERLRGATIWIPETERMPLAEDQFYLSDVVGLQVVHVNGQPLGQVVDVITGSGNDLFVVRAIPSGREVLLPVVRAFIREIDIPAGVLRVDPIPGLFDEQAEIANDAKSPNALVLADEADKTSDEAE